MSTGCRRYSLRFLASLAACLLPACGSSDSKQAITLSTVSAAFTAVEGGVDPANQIIALQAAPNRLLYGRVRWVATSDQPWLTLSPGAGTILAGESGLLSLHVNPRLQVEGWVGATSTTGAPSPRRIHSQVWTGDQMVVWGGSASPAAQYDDGGRYDPATNTWLGTTSMVSVPSARQFHSGIWTGTTMIVWGGWSVTTGYVNTGGIYAPDSWLGVTNTTGAIGAREAHTAVWTGDRMIVWGGYATGDYDTGALYDPVADSWTGSTATTGAPGPRQEHAAVWTGSRMIVWGGRHIGAAPFGGSLNTGGLYDPATDTWSGTTTTTGAPSPRIQPSAVWTGREMILWVGMTRTPATSILPTESDTTPRRTPG